LFWDIREVVRANELVDDLMDTMRRLGLREARRLISRAKLIFNLRYSSIVYKWSS
jgi:hypothetical protein